MFLSKQHKYIIAAIILSTVLLRLVPHIPNFAPLAAGAMFAAAYLPKKYVLVVPLVAAIVSDYLLLYISPFGDPVFNFSQIQPISAIFNGTTAYVWGSFMLCGLLGLFLRKKQNPLRVVSISMASSIQFFLITNFGVWAAGAYARDISGLGASYIAGLPFLQWTMLGDLFYAGCFFGLYAFIAKQLGQRQQAEAAASS